MQKHSNNCWLKLKNFVIYLHRTAWIIVISTAVVKYVLYTNYCQTLTLGSFYSLLFTVYYSLYQSSFRCCSK